MKKETAQLIKKDLLTSGANTPLLATCRISRHWINYDLIRFMKRLLAEASDDIERLLMFNKLRILVIETSREPDADEMQTKADEFREHRAELKREQALHEPIRWIDANIAYLLLVKSTMPEKNEATKDLEAKTWITSDDVCRLFDISRTSLNRRVADGMPVHGLGGKAMYYRQEVDAWLMKQQVTLEI